jgi:hypothetical protein
LLKYAKLRGVPFHETVADESKLVPVSVMSSPAVPGRAAAGLRDDNVGTGLLSDVGTGVLPPLWVEPPPQPAKKNKTISETASDSERSDLIMSWGVLRRRSRAIVCYRTAKRESMNELLSLGPMRVSSIKDSSDPLTIESCVRSSSLRSIHYPAAFCVPQKVSALDGGYTVLSLRHCLFVILNWREQGWVLKKSILLKTESKSVTRNV